MNNEAIRTTTAPIAATAFGEEVGNRHRKVSWAVTYKDFTIPVGVRPYYKTDGKRGFMATLDAGTFLCWPEGMPDNLTGIGTLTVSVPTGADVEPELDEERGIVKLPCRTKFVRFDAE